MAELRPYQRDSIDAVFTYWRDGEAGNPLIDLATGTGKSVVLAQFMRELLESWPDMRILCLVHVRELVLQNFQQLIRFWPQAPAGINSAGLGRRDTQHPIIFASIQSVFRKAERLGRRDLVLVDEAHLLPAHGEGMYHALLKTLRERAPDLRVMGCTATPYRLDSGRLDRGPNRFFDRIVYSYGIADGIRDGYLSPLTSKGMKAEINVARVDKRGGEFVAGALAQAADQIDLVKGACTEIMAHGTTRKSWLLFCSSVDHAHHVCAELQARGVYAETVTGDTPKGERDRILNGFKTGQIRAVCNCSVLTTGFDAPNVDLIALLRPTLSTGLYVQMLGRGTRKAVGKSDCLILDFAGNVRRHGPVDMIEVGSGAAKKSKASKDDEEVAVKENSIKAKACPTCQTLNALHAAACVGCGFEWPVAAPHSAVADTVNILSGRDAQGFLTVMDVHYYRHVKRHAVDAPPSLRVTYGVGISAINAWHCFSHPQGSIAQRKAGNWWLQAGGRLPIPVSVDEALHRTTELQMPEAIKFKRDESGFNKVEALRYAKWLPAFGPAEETEQAGAS